MLKDSDFDNIDLEKEVLEIDKSVGERIKSRRVMLGITQKDLGKIIGVTPQQIQKYETATNRVSCSTLYLFAKYLDTSIDYFFRFTEENQENSDFCVREEQSPFITNQETEVSEREIIKLIGTYRSIKNIDLRRKISQLIEAMVKVDL